MTWNLSNWAHSREQLINSQLRSSNGAKVFEQRIYGATTFLHDFFLIFKGIFQLAMVFFKSYKIGEMHGGRISSANLVTRQVVTHFMYPSCFLRLQIDSLPLPVPLPSHCDVGTRRKKGYQKYWGETLVVVIPELPLKSGRCTQRKQVKPRTLRLEHSLAAILPDEDFDDKPIKRSKSLPSGFSDRLSIRKMGPEMGGR